MSTTSRSLLLALLGCLALGLAACGGTEDEAAGDDARALLQAAYAAEVPSATLDLRATAALEGSPVLQGPLEITLRGPYEQRGETELPLVDWDVSVSGAGTELAGALALTEDNGFVTFEGDAFEIGAERLAELTSELGRGPGSLEELGLDPVSWLSDARLAEGEEIDGAGTRKVTATLDVARVLEDYNTAIERDPDAFGENAVALTDEQVQEVSGAVQEATLDSFVGVDDDALKGLDLTVAFAVPEERRAEAQVDGGTVTVALRLSDVGDPVTVETPADAAPIEELLGQLLQRFWLGGAMLDRQ
jgi:hypothetical protein